MKSIFCGNISWKATEDDLKKTFESYGTVNSSRIITDRDSGRSKGFGFIEMDEEGAEKAIKEMNGKDFMGRPLVVNEARRRENREQRF